MTYCTPVHTHLVEMFDIGHLLWQGETIKVCGKRISIVDIEVGKEPVDKRVNCVDLV